MLDKIPLTGRLVGAVVAHDAHRAHGGKEDGKGLQSFDRLPKGFMWEFPKITGTQYGPKTMGSLIQGLRSRTPFVLETQ